MEEVLWTKFETAFKAMWKDRAKTQSAYEQLIKLSMKDLEINAYIATFKWLIVAVGWEPTAGATIAKFCQGLRDNIHRWLINRENRPTTMDEWKDMARQEVDQIRELAATGLNRFQKQGTCDFSQFQAGQTS